MNSQQQQHRDQSAFRLGYRTALYQVYATLLGYHFGDITDDEQVNWHTDGARMHNDSIKNIIDQMLEKDPLS